MFSGGTESWHMIVPGLFWVVTDICPGSVNQVTVQHTMHIGNWEGQPSTASTTLTSQMRVEEGFQPVRPLARVTLFVAIYLGFITRLLTLKSTPTPRTRCCQTC